MDTRYYDSIEVLDELIVGRVEPKIYAFTTNTIPNYLKVGDTCRPVNIRLKEWEKEYPSLKKNMKVRQQLMTTYIFVITQFINT